MNHRRLSWLRAVVAIALASALAVGWALTIAERSNRSPDGEVAPGQFWLAPKGERVRITKWTIEDQLFAAKRPVKPEPGRVFVVVTLQYTNSHQEADCEPLLFGAGLESWQAANGFYDIEQGDRCNQGIEATANVVYQVSRAKVDDLRGVSFPIYQSRQPPLLLFPERG